MASKRVFITRTSGEFDTIGSRIKELGKPNMQVYLRSEICKIRSGFDRQPTSITTANGEKIIKSYYISEDCYNVLKRLSIMMKRPIASVFDELLISPLLRPDTLSVL